MAMVRGGGAHGFEKRAAGAVRVEIARPGGGVFSGQSAQFGDVLSEAFELGVDHGVGAVGGDHAAVPIAVADRLMPAQIVQSAFGGGERFDLEAVKEGAGAEGVLGQAGFDVVIVVIGGFGRQGHVEAEDMFKRMVEPDRRGRAPEQVVVRRQQVPDLARIGFDRAAIDAGDTEIGHRHALAHQHPEHIVIGHHEQFRRVREPRVFGEPARIAMAVRAQDRQVLDAVIERAGQIAQAGFHREQAVGVGQGHGCPSLVVV